MGSYDFDEVENAIEIGKAEGAKVLCGGDRLTGGIYDEDYYLAPPCWKAPAVSAPRSKRFHYSCASARALPYEAALFMRNSQKRSEAV